MNANIQQEWQINLGQGWALMLWTGREHCGARWGKTHTHACKKTHTDPRFKDRAASAHMGKRAHAYVHTVMHIMCVHNWSLIIHQSQWSMEKWWTTCGFNGQFKAGVGKTHNVHPSFILPFVPKGVRGSAGAYLKQTWGKGREHILDRSTDTIYLNLPLRAI